MEQLDRRSFLTRFGRATFAVAVFGAAAAACSSDGATTTTTVGAATTTGAPSSTTTAPLSTTSPPTTQPAIEPGGAGVTFERVSLGNVSAYILVRDGEGAIVDTGNPGSASAIETSLDTIGLGWNNVGHVILTHRHSDHVGSVAEVLAAATAATAYAGAADIDQISAPSELTAVSDSDSVFGLDIVATPGHTAGHIAVYDPLSKILVAGDALIGANGTVAGPSPQFTSDEAAAAESVRKLATLDIDTILFGHGEPVEGGAGPALADLAASL